jgi:S1-C subfamily serine protease
VWRSCSSRSAFASFITRRDTELSEKRVELGVSDDIAAIEALTPAMLVALGEKGVKTLDDLTFALRGQRAGQRVEIVVVRDRQQHRMEAVLEERR